MSMFGKLFVIILLGQNAFASGGFHTVPKSVEEPKKCLVYDEDVQKISYIQMIKTIQELKSEIEILKRKK
jgi:hypothetical protein